MDIFFTYICCKNCNDECLKRPKINEKEAGVGPFIKNYFLSSFTNNKKALNYTSSLIEHLSHKINFQIWASKSSCRCNTDPSFTAKKYRKKDIYGSDLMVTKLAFYFNNMRVNSAEVYG